MTNESYLKGGSWNSGPRYCQSALCIYTDPGCQDRTFGFRLLFVRVKHDKNNC